ncbi:MAG: stage II sporulation protein M [Desulfuromonadales bacterium]
MSAARSTNGFFKSIFADLSEARDFIWSAAILFGSGALAGYFFPAVSRQLLFFFAEIAHQLLQYGAAELALQIFFRNFLASGIAVFAGALFGLLPTAAVVNGLIFGAITSLAPGEMWKVAPHGVFELPAMFVSWGMGLWLSLWVVGPGRLSRLQDRLKRCFRIFIGLIAPVLLLAAIIEAATASYLFGNG